MEQEVREEYYNNAMGDVPANQPGQPVEVVQQQEPATEQAGAQESTEEQPVVQADAQQMGEAPAAPEPVDYETADAASIVRDLMERRGYTSEVVGDYIAQRIEQAKEALKKTEKMVKPEFKDPLPKLKNADLEKYDTDMAAWNVKKARINARTKQYEADKAAAVQAAQAEIDRWQGVQDYITGEAAAREQAEQAEREVTVGKQIDEITPLEIASVQQDGNPSTANKKAEDGVITHSTTSKKITEEERTAMQSRIVDWLSDDNLSIGKTRDEIFQIFGNEPEPIGYIPHKYLSFINSSIRDPRIYCGKGYFIEHALRNHGKANTQIPIEDVDASKYLRLSSNLVGITIFCCNICQPSRKALQLTLITLAGDNNLLQA